MDYLILKYCLLTICMIASIIFGGSEVVRIYGISVSDEEFPYLLSNKCRIISWGIVLGSFAILVFLMT